MKVKEIIEYLSGYTDDAEVSICPRNCDLFEEEWEIDKLVEVTGSSDSVFNGVYIFAK